MTTLGKLMNTTETPTKTTEKSMTNANGCKRQIVLPKLSKAQVLASEARKRAPDRKTKNKRQSQKHPHHQSSNNNRQQPPTTTTTTKNKNNHNQQPTPLGIATTMTQKKKRTPIQKTGNERKPMEQPRQRRTTNAKNKEQFKANEWFKKGKCMNTNGKMMKRKEHEGKPMAKARNMKEKQ